MDSKKESNASKMSAEYEEDEDLDTMLDEALMDFKSRETKKTNWYIIISDNYFFPCEACCEYGIASSLQLKPNPGRGPD